jgi:hypothetical protein
MRMARTDQLKKTARDMLMSMALIALPILAIVLFFPHDSKSPEDSVQTVDYSVSLQQARDPGVLPFEALAPVGLPAGWRATSVHAAFDTSAPLRWELGFQSPDKQYVALVQVTGGKLVQDVLDTQCPDATAGATTTAGGFTWTEYTSGDGKRRALGRTEQGSGTTPATPVGVVVAGTGSFAELEEFASALK